MANNEPKVLVDAPKKTPDTFDNGGQETPVDVVTDPKKQAKPTFKGLKLGKLLAETNRDTVKQKGIKFVDFSNLSVDDIVAIKVYDDDDGTISISFGAVTERGPAIGGEALTISTDFVIYDLEANDKDAVAKLTFMLGTKKLSIVSLYANEIQLSGKVEIYEIGTK